MERTLEVTESRTASEGADVEPGFRDVEAGGGLSPALEALLRRLARQLEHPSGGEVAKESLDSVIAALVRAAKIAGNRQSGS